MAKRAGRVTRFMVIKDSDMEAKQKRPFKLNGLF